MKKDFMNTQTGGKGETIQAMPNAEPTAEQFEANITPTQETQDAQAETVTEQVAPPAEPVVPEAETAKAPIEGEPVKKEGEKKVAGPVEEADAIVGEKLLSMPEAPNAEAIDWTSPNATNLDLSEVDEQADGVVLQNLSSVTPDGLYLSNQPQKEEKKEEPSNASDLNEEVAEKPFGSQVTPDGLHLNNDFSGVGKLPMLPLGVDSKEFVDLRNKYQGYEVKSDAWGNVSVTKTTPATQVVGGKQKQQVPVKEKPDYTKELKYQVLSYPPAKNYEYIIGNEGWFRRTKGSKDWNLLTNENSVKALNTHFKTNVSTTKKYSYPGREGYEYAVINGNWNIKKKDSADWTKITQPERVKELNRYTKQNVKMPLTAREQAFNKAAEIQKSVGNEVSPTVLNPTAIFSDGQPVVGIMADANSLFTDNRNKKFILGNTDEQVRNTEIEGLKKQRDLELSYAKTEAQKKQVNDRFNSLIFEQEEKKTMIATATKKANKEAVEYLAEPKAESHIITSANGGVFNIIQDSNGNEINVANLNAGALSQIKGYGEDDLGLGILLDRQRAEEAYRMAKAFSDKDLDSWGNSYGVFLTKEQLAELKPIQDRFKAIVANEKITPMQALYLKDEMKKLTERVNLAKEINEEINKAAYEGKSMSEYQLDQKKALIAEEMSVEELGGKESFAGRTKNLFNITAEMHDFMIDYVKSGKVTQDEKGLYRINPNLSENEKVYLNKRLNGYIAKYTEAKATEYNTLQDDISALKSKKKNQQVAIDVAIKNLSKLEKGSEEYDNALSSINKAKKHSKYLSERIDKLSNENRGFFLTEPKALAKTATEGIEFSSAESIFNSIDKSLSPKQRFDMFYHKLAEENKRLAADNGIDTKNLGIGTELRSWLDMESLGISLTKEERKFYANNKILISLMPLYYNNENGITEGSASFFNSFMSSFESTLIGEDLATSVGNFTQSKAVNNQVEKLYKLGYTKEDLADPINLKDLEQRQNVSWLSGEGAGEILGTTAAIISELVIANELGVGVLKIGKGAANLFTVTEGLGAVKLGDKIQKSYKIYEAAMQSNKVGKYLWKAAEEGVKLESAGNIFGNSEGELNFMSGFAGGLASELLTGLASKIPANKLLPIVDGLFGSRADDAIAVFKKMGAVSSRGGGEVAEEFAQELVSIYNSELKDRGFWEEVENRFGTFDKVMQFTVSSFVLGAGFGFGKTSEAQDLLETMTPEDRAKVEAVITESRQSFEQATEARNIANEAINKQIKNEARIEGIPDTEAPTIEWDITNEKASKNDKENESGVSGKVGEGQEPVQAEPVAKTSEEEASPSGVVQKEQEVERLRAEEQAELSKAIPNIDEYKVDGEIDKESMPEDVLAKYNEIYNKYDAKITPLLPATQETEVSPATIEAATPTQEKTFEVHVGGIESGFTESAESKDKSPGDIRNQIESAPEDYGVIVTKGTTNGATENDTFVVAYSKIGGDRQRITEKNGGRSGWVSASVKVSENATEQEIAEAKAAATAKMNEILPNIQGGKFVLSNVDASTSVTIGGSKAQATPTTEATTPTEPTSNPFEDVKGVASLPSRSNKKRQAIEDFDLKHGEGAFERVSKIDSNFGKIVTKLEKNSIIEKEC
jgi:hypothetical protein